MGIVDMPGHERFVRTMVAGASGIDFVLLVISADEGVMPQTREHLEICTKEPREVLPLILNAGAVFLGENAPEPLGDYLAGPNHVLPTSGTARFFSPLSVDSFLKTMSILEYSRENLEQQWKQIVTFAKAEFLTAHANSIEVRFEDEKA